MNRTNKKGLIEQFPHLIMEIGVIVLVIFLLVGLYTLFVNPDKKNAKAFLDNLAGKIGNLEEGKTANFAIQGFSDKWYLVGWNKEDSLGIKPEKCFEKSCLCLCQKGSGANCPTNNDCQQNGLCRNYDEDTARVMSSPRYGFVEECLKLENKQLIDITISKKKQNGIGISDDGSLLQVYFEDSSQEELPRA